MLTYAVCACRQRHACVRAFLERTMRGVLAALMLLNSHPPRAPPAALYAADAVVEVEDAALHTHTSAYVSIRAHTSALHTHKCELHAFVRSVAARYVSVCQRMPAYASVCQRMPAYAS